MTISTADWKRYINRLRRISDKAAEEMQRWVQLHGFGDTDALIEYAYALATKYGEAAATAACDMFDAVAEASGVTIPGALPAETATYGETARAVNGTLKQGEALVPDVVGRLVKQAGADTTLQNAEHYGAEFAWVPMGDTCSFCRMLASNGWQRQSKKAMKGGHAEHIHANCDCQYAVRFDGKGGVAGYDPDKYKAEYDAAEGDNWREKLNSMRRAQYKQDGEKIRAQKRITYAAKREAEELEKSWISGIIKIDADGTTPCLVDRKTGEILSTSVARVTDANELRGYTKKTGWFINWREIAKTDGVEVYKLLLDRDNSLQGLTAITPQRGFVQLNWCVANPLSQSDVVGSNNKQYVGIGGHLFAIAAKRSIELGNGGYLTGKAASQELLNYYCKNFGASPLPVRYDTNLFILDEESAQRLINIYTFDWG